MRNIIKFKQKDGTIKYRLIWIDETSDSDEHIVEYVTEKEFESLMNSADFQENARIVEWPCLPEKC